MTDTKNKISNSSEVIFYGGIYIILIKLIYKKFW